MNKLNKWHIWIIMRLDLSGSRLVRTSTCKMPQKLWTGWDLNLRSLTFWVKTLNITSPYHFSLKHTPVQRNPSFDLIKNQTIEQMEHVLLTRNMWSDWNSNLRPLAFWVSTLTITAPHHFWLRNTHSTKNSVLGFNEQFMGLNIWNIWIIKSLDL